MWKEEDLPMSFNFFLLLHFASQLTERRLLPNVRNNLPNLRSWRGFSAYFISLQHQRPRQYENDHQASIRLHDVIELRSCQVPRPPKKCTFRRLKSSQLLLVFNVTPFKIDRNKNQNRSILCFHVTSSFSKITN